MKRYAAYGSNINIGQMAHRCPEASIVGTGRLHGYKLTFRRGGFANIEPADGESVPVLVWNTTAKDERALDRYEGYPNFYRKDYVNIEMDDGGELKTYIYIMTDEKRGGYHAQHPGYLNGIICGYDDNNMDIIELVEAVYRTRKCINAYREGYNG